MGCGDRGLEERGGQWQEVEGHVLEAGLSVMPRVLIMTGSPVSQEWQGGWGT